MAHTEIGVGVSFKGHVAITSNKSESPVWLLASGMGFWGRGSLFSHKLRFKAHPAQPPAPRARNSLTGDEGFIVQAFGFEVCELRGIKSTMGIGGRYTELCVEGFHSKNSVHFLVGRRVMIMILACLYWGPILVETAMSYGLLGRVGE